MAESTETERGLRDRNQKLAETLREARDQMVELKDGLDSMTKTQAVTEALDYAVLAVHERIDAIKRAIRRDEVGQERDEAIRYIPQERICLIFEQALTALGYSIVPSRVIETEATS